MKKKIVLAAVSIGLMGMLVGCVDERQSDKVNYNLSQEADNFNVIRQLTVVNCIQGDVIFQMTGKMSINADAADNQLEVIVQNSDGSYQKHFVGLSDNVTYTLEQLNYKNVDKYQYTLNFNPKMWIPAQPGYVD